MPGKNEPETRVYRGYKRMIFDNFIGGIAWALGATVGLAIVFTLLSVILKNVNLIPVIGGFVSQVTTFVLQNNPQLR